MSASFEFPELLGPTAVAEAWAGGRAEGLAAARAELHPALEALAAAARALDDERTRALAAVERDAAELALQLADKVVGAALEVRPELVVDLVRGALRRLAEQQDTAVLVNPDDLEEIRTALDSLTAETGMPLTVRAERRVPRGGCVLRTQAGEIDARVDEQLARAREVVEAALAR
jgi:flagellar biosynthesis/type III secretory pathway protein FliH